METDTQIKEYIPTWGDKSAITYDTAMKFLTDEIAPDTVAADYDNGVLVKLSLCADENGPSLWRDDGGNSPDLFSAKELRESTFCICDDAYGNKCLYIEHPDTDGTDIRVLRLSALRQATPKVPYAGLYLDPDVKYSRDDIHKYLNSLGNITNWDSLETISDGVLLDGDYLVYLDTPVNKWMYVCEDPLGAWSSCYRIKYFDKDDVPQALWDAARDYELTLKEIDDNFDVNKHAK